MIPSDEVPIDVLRTRFMDYGVQYYVAGRCSVAAALNVVAANVL